MTMVRSPRPLDVNGTRFEVIEQGTGEPVVFVHGSASDYRTWEPQLDDLGSLYRAIAYSRRYHWPNDRIPHDADYSMGEHVDDLQALLDSLDIRSVHLVGHSYGAFVALRRRLPERCGGARSGCRRTDYISKG